MTVTLAPCPVSVLMKHQSTGVGLSTFAKLGGGIPDPFYIAASAPSGIFTPGGFSVGNAGFDKVSITFTVIPTLTVGDHTGSVDLKFCGDSHCTNVLTEVQLPYTIHVVVPPHLSQLSPVSLLLAAKPFTLKLMGSGFRSGSKLRFGGLLLNTNFVSPVELTAQVDLSKVLKGQDYNVTVVPTGNFPSNTKVFALNNPKPVITQLSPASSTVGRAPFTLTVVGKGFFSGSKINLGGTALATKYVSATKLTATVDLSTTTTTAVDTITVVSPPPGGGTSAGASFDVNNPVPVITLVLPNDVPTPTSNVTSMEVDGSGFQLGSVIRWNGTDLPTGYHSSTKLTATTPAGGLSAVGDVTIDVTTPGPGGGTSNSSIIAIGQPQLSWISPTVANLGQGDLTLTVEGTNFTPSTEVEWNGAPLTTVSAAGNIIQVTVPAADLATAGSATVSVVNAGLASVNNSRTFNVGAPGPMIASLSPGFATTGAGSFTLTVFGDNFTPNAMVEWNGTNLTTTFVSGSELKATVPARDLTTHGMAVITVFDPLPINNGSKRATFSVSADGTVVTSMAQAASDVEWAPLWDLMFVSVPTGAASNPQSLLQVDPLTQTVVRSQSLSAVPGVTGFSPDQLSLSGDGDLLYMSGSDWVLRFDGNTFPTQLENGYQAAGATIAAMQPSPAVSQIVSWISVKSGTATRLVDSNGGATSSNTAEAWSTLAWSPDGNTLYSADGTSGADFSSLSYGITTGAQNETVTPGLWSGTRMQVDAASGLVYADNSPNVIDPAGPSVVGTFPVSGVMVPDSSLGCAYFITQTAAQVTAAAGDWTLSCYSTADQTLTRSIVIPAVNGTPTKMLRWGNEGLAFITDGGYIYFVSGQAVTGN